MFRPKLTYANVVSTLCLFLLLGGGAYAAIKLPKNSVGTKQLKKNAVTLAKINGSARASLEGQKGDTGPRGEPGPTGETGPRGPAGSDFNGVAAGGDLTGTYPNPKVGLVQVGGADQTDSEGFAFLLPPWNGFADITTDGDADADNTVRVLNTSSKKIHVRWSTAQANFNPGGVATVELSVYVTPFFIWSDDGRSWLVTCAEFITDSSIRCQGLANRVG